MTRVSRSDGQRFQVNVPLDDAHWHLVLLQLAIREGQSVPELLRPVIIRYLKRQLSADEQLAAAVKNLEESKRAASQRARRRRRLADVKELPANGGQGSRLRHPSRERPESQAP